MNTETINRRPRPFRSNGDLIRSARNRIGGFTQEQAAAKTGISRRYWIQLETGEKLPSGVLRDKIAAALETDPTTIRSSDDDDEESSLPLTRDDFELLGVLMSRLGATIERTTK